MDIQAIAKEIRKDVIRMTYAAGAQGAHIGGSLSMCEIMAVLYHEVMRIDANDPLIDERDRFILSKGHGAIAMFAALKSIGLITDEELMSYKHDGSIITAKSSPLLGCSAALLLNATKHLAGIDHEAKLIPQSLIEPVQKTKTEYLGGINPRLHTDEVLIALSVSAATNPSSSVALSQLPKLRGCEVHSTVILSQQDEMTFKRLGVNLTCEPKFSDEIQ